MTIPMQQPFLEIEPVYGFAYWKPHFVSPVGSSYIDKLVHSPLPKVVNKRGFSWHCETRTYLNFNWNILLSICWSLWWKKPLSCDSLEPNVSHVFECWLIWAYFIIEDLAFMISYPLIHTIMSNLLWILPPPKAGTLAVQVPTRCFSLQSLNNWRPSFTSSKVLCISQLRFFTPLLTLHIPLLQTKFSLCFLDFDWIYLLSTQLCNLHIQEFLCTSHKAWHHGGAL